MACLEAVEVVVRPPVVCSALVEVFWLILRELDEPVISVGLAVLAERLAVLEAVPVVCSKPVETMVLLGLAGLVALVRTEPGDTVVLLE